MKKIGLLFAIVFTLIPLMFLNVVHASYPSNYTFKLLGIVANGYDYYTLTVDYTNYGTQDALYWIDVTGNTDKGEINTWTTETLYHSGTLDMKIHDVNLSLNIHELNFEIKVHMDTSDAKAVVPVDLSAIGGSTSTPTPTPTSTSTTTTETLLFGNIDITNIVDNFDEYKMPIGIGAGVLLLLIIIIVASKKKKKRKQNKNDNYQGTNNNYSSNNRSSNNYSNNNNKNSYNVDVDSIFDNSTSKKDYSYNNQKSYSSNNYQSNNQDQSVRSVSRRYSQKNVSKRRTATGSFIIGFFFLIFSLIALFVFLPEAMEAYRQTGQMAFVLIPGIMVVFGIIISIIAFAFAIKKRIVKLHGKQSVGVVRRLWEEKTTQTSNGATSTYTNYYMEFDYEDEFGEAVTMVELLTRKYYKNLRVNQQIPILVYKKDAMFNSKLFKSTGGFNSNIESNVSFNIKRRIFISYRRDGGLDSAELLYAKLQKCHLPYMDSNLSFGNYLPQLMENIDNCEVFLVILSNNALVKRENDVYFQEIRRAMEKKKIIIPVILDSFDFPENNKLWNFLKGLQCVKMSKTTPGYADDTVNRINTMLEQLTR